MAKKEEVPRSRLKPRHEARRGTGVYTDDNGTEWPFYVDVGFDGDLRGRETFIRLKSQVNTSFMNRLFDDIGTIISYCLQRGYTLEELKHGMGRNGGYPGAESDQETPPASLIGAVIDVAIELEAERRQPELVID